MRGHVFSKSLAHDGGVGKDGHFELVDAQCEERVVAKSNRRYESKMLPSSQLSLAVRVIVVLVTDSGLNHQHSRIGAMSMCSFDLGRWTSRNRASSILIDVVSVMAYESSAGS